MERMALATLMVHCTISGERELGMIYLMMICISLAPMALAASIYSCSLTVSTEARTTRAKVGVWATRMAMIRLTLLVPKAATMAVASKMVGTARRISMIRMIMPSAVL